MRPDSLVSELELEDREVEDTSKELDDYGRGNTVSFLIP